MRGDANSTQIQVLDGPALRVLSTELNSSKYAIDAHNRSIGEISNLSELPKLCSLDVSFNKITSLRNVSSARELRELKIYNNKLTNTIGLKANSNLEDLQMNDNQIEEISTDFLALNKLKNLWLNGNRITAVRNLRGCRLLVYLDLGRNKLHGAASEGLDALSNLEVLNLGGNQLTSVGNLSHLTKLEELNLSENNLTTLQGVMPPNLAILRVNGNQIPNFQGLLTPLEKLNELYAHDNSIADIQLLPSRCPQLESIDLRNNNLELSSQITILAKCETLRDIWLHGNPCCYSNSYLIDVMNALPELKTLDTFTDAQLQASRDKLKQGTVSQGELLSSSRVSTPSYRPGSAASRPGSARVRTPSARLATPDTVPVFHTPSSRIGNLTKLASTEELARAQDEVRGRLQKMKQMLNRVGSHGAADQLQPTKRRTPAPLDSIARIPKIAQRARTVKSLLIRRSCVDAACEIETQTSLPPAPVLSVSKSKSICGLEPNTTTTMEEQHDLNNEGSMSLEGDTKTTRKGETPREPQQDSDAIETEMKQFLMQHVMANSDDNQNKAEEKPEEDFNSAKFWSDSPRLDTIKTAELRKPPISLARTGYRSFRLPSRPSSSKNS
ncbi:protein phosphatase 1 regulatory subunit 7, putative [Phytophthora infestans T30-4]|uniref:Protein phosphatase 1 regulatory subunit 7, putative n=1 Tax=Phytophthora infestans (strain T30-4) TaxID=403677 RepID=D0NV18_PHYIT|nr:protein phosphatase 1 regulatory subunit 7, putative [Phytophthora infestans T30-4]EEY66490.1 protein phosphatase 1 regulatory subunit 7, putative [Phytophthora infestans T30-4]|eukprot:XP_002897009.1 protein phosphatase 1 regulatory subunit 7, putative [Phytophthora infestans T30-4]